MTEFEQFLGWTPAQWTAVKLWAARRGHAVPSRVLPQSMIEIHEPGVTAGWMHLQVLWLNQNFTNAPPSIGEEIMAVTR